MKVLIKLLQEIKKKKIKRSKINFILRFLEKIKLSKILTIEKELGIKLTEEQKRYIKMPDEAVEYYIFTYPIEKEYKDMIDELYIGKVYNPIMEKYDSYSYKGSRGLLKYPYTKIEMLEIVIKWKDKSEKELLERWEYMLSSTEFEGGAKAVFHPYYFLEAIIIAELIFRKKGVKTPLPIGVSYPKYISDITKIKKDIKDKLIIELRESINTLVKEKKIKKEEAIKESKEKRLLEFTIYYILKKNGIKLEEKDFSKFSEEIIEKL